MAAAIDEHSTLVLAGATLPASERGLLNAYAAYAKVMDERRRRDRGRGRAAAADRGSTAPGPPCWPRSPTTCATRSPRSRWPSAACAAPTSTWSPEDEAELLATIEESTDRLTALVANLLDMSRISTGSVTRRRCAEVGLADAVRASIAPLPGGERIEVDVDPDAAWCSPTPGCSTGCWPTSARTR